MPKHQQCNAEKSLSIGCLTPTGISFLLPTPRASRSAWQSYSCCVVRAGGLAQAFQPYSWLTFPQLGSLGESGDAFYCWGARAGLWARWRHTAVASHCSQTSELSSTTQGGAVPTICIYCRDLGSSVFFFPLVYSLNFSVEDPIPSCCI